MNIGVNVFAQFHFFYLVLSNNYSFFESGAALFERILMEYKFWLTYTHIYKIESDTFESWRIYRFIGLQ